VLGGPEGYLPQPAKMTLGPIVGWHLIFLVAAVPTVIMAICYWLFTEDPPQRKSPLSLAEIFAVYKSGPLVWIVTYLYWTSFGTLTFFSATTPTYLVDRWGVDPTEASMLFTASLVVFVAFMRPVGGWLSDRLEPLKMLTWLFGGAAIFTIVLLMEVSLTVQIWSIYAMALISGAASATVIKLIPTYFTQVGAVSGLAKAAGAACGFTMTMVMAFSKNMTQGYTLGFAVWAAMNVLAFYLAYRRTGFPEQEPRLSIETAAAAA
jgi:NNP family nitrate/nitrite transporter-like MFS transporter